MPLSGKALSWDCPRSRLIWSPFPEDPLKLALVWLLKPLAQDPGFSLSLASLTICRTPASGQLLGRGLFPPVRVPVSQPAQQTPWLQTNSFYGDAAVSSFLPWLLSFLKLLLFLYCVLLGVAFLSLTLSEYNSGTDSCTGNKTVTKL